MSNPEVIVLVAIVLAFTGFGIVLAYVDRIAGTRERAQGPAE